MLPHYVLFSMLFSILPLAKETNQDSTPIGINIAIFLLIVAMIFVSYRILMYYLSKRKSRKRKKNVEHVISTTLNENDTLLNEGKDLIQFLKMSTQANRLQNETFRVQNLINSVYGLLESIIEKNHIEFTYDVDSSIPIELIGDSLLLEQALYHLLSDMLNNMQNTTVIVTFKKYLDEITIQIQSDENIELKNNTTFDTVHTLLAEYSVRLELKDNTYNIYLPFLRNEVYIESYYSLPETVVDQKVLLINDSKITAKIIAKALQHFGLTVHIEPTSKLTAIQDFSRYDILIIDSKLLTPVILRHLEEIKNKKSLYIISLETLYRERDRRFKPNPLISKYMYNPLSMGMVFRFLYEIYVMQKDVDIPTTNKLLKQRSELIFIEEAEHVTRESFQDFNHTHILLVEDNIINQKIIQSILEKANIDITIANNGQEALTCLDEEQTIDMVLMDINMPIMDGYQATKKIRENKANATLPIVILSALGFRNDIEEMYRVGANAHLTKPFKIGQLYNAFEMFLNKNNQEENATSQYNVVFNEDINTLDIQKGAASVENILAYRDTLRETLVILEYSNEKIKENIIKKDFITLYTYCSRAVEDSKHIGATSLTQVLNEILLLLHNKEEELLHNYITLYHDSWMKTRRDIELYLKSVNAY